MFGGKENIFFGNVSQSCIRSSLLRSYPPTILTWVLCLGKGRVYLEITSPIASTFSPSAFVSCGNQEFFPLLLSIETGGAIRRSLFLWIPVDLHMLILSKTLTNSSQNTIIFGYQNPVNAVGCDAEPRSIRCQQFSFNTTTFFHKDIA